MSNLTYFLGRIAFRDCRKELNLLESFTHLVSQRVLGFEFFSLNSIRIVETFETANAKGHLEEVEVRTDLVPFLEPQKSMSHLLIYSLRESSLPWTQLITSFPISQSTYDELLDPSLMGHQVPIRLRYNASISSAIRSSIRNETESFPGVRTLHQF